MGVVFLTFLRGALRTELDFGMLEIWHFASL